MRIVIVGGGSRQWGPKLVTDILTTPSLSGATVVLHDIDAASLEPIATYASLVADEVGSDATIDTTTDRAAALRDADYVDRDDLDRRVRVDAYGPRGAGAVRHPAVGRRLRRSRRDQPRAAQHPGAGRDRTRHGDSSVPHAWLLNITNPMTCLTRAVARETSIKVVGLCHEVVIMSWFVAIACGVPRDRCRVSRSPASTTSRGSPRCRSAVTTGFARLRRVLDSGAGRASGSPTRTRSSSGCSIATARCPAPVIATWPSSSRGC